VPLQIVTAPYAEPIDIAEAMDNARALDDGSDDAIFSALVPTAREAAEHITQRQLVAARWKVTLDRFCDPIWLPKSPAVQVISVKYLDFSGTLQTLATTEYVVDLVREPARIMLPYGKVWPVTLPQTNAVQVVFDAGYAAPFTADKTADTIAIAGNLWKALAVDDVVRLSNSGGNVPEGLSLNVDYYIHTVVSPGVYKLKSSIGGGALDITDVGVGTHFIGSIPDGIKSWMKLRIGSLYQNREESVVGGSMRVEALPFADRLLDPYLITYRAGSF
jgi:uncharacterized phiE125 gp8 family phage protein